MKALVLASALAVIAAPAFAQTATTSNNATIGVQSNTQVGGFNTGTNTAAITQSGAANANGFLPGGFAQALNNGNIGAQTNFQNGFNNVGNNAATIAQNANANAFGAGFPQAFATQNGNIGAQLNEQLGALEGGANVGNNFGAITQNANALANGLDPLVVPGPEVALAPVVPSMPVLPSTDVPSVPSASGLSGEIRCMALGCEAE